MLSTGKNSPLVLIYGCSFKDDYLVAYAKRHRLLFEPDVKHRDWLGCPTPEFNFADVTEDNYRRKNVVSYLRIMARMIVLQGP